MHRSKQSHTFRFYRLFIQLCMLIILSISNSAYAAKKAAKIEQFSLNRSVAYLGEEISADITVNARGSIRSKKLHLRYYLDKKEIGNQIVPAFDVSGNANTIFKFKDAAEGRYQFRVELTIEGQKGSIDEVGRQLAILSLPTGMTEHSATGGLDEISTSDRSTSVKADLSADDISFNIPSPRVGEKITIRTKISNTGSVQADNVKIRIFINGQPYGKDLSMNIAAGSQVNIDTEYVAGRQGKKDVLVFINPDGEIDEKSNRNNLLSKILIVRPAGSGKKSKKSIVTAEKKIQLERLANLVIYIETITGAHYTSNGKVNFYITNNSQSVETGKFTLGVRHLQSSPEKTWLLRKPVKGLKPGETVAIAVQWPEDRFAPSELFIATVDIEGKIHETDIRDNLTRPFRVVSTAPLQTETKTASNKISKPESPKAGNARPEIIITSPLNNGRLNNNGTLIVNWQTSGDIGSLVHITVQNARTKEVVLSSTSNNDGAYSTDLSQLQNGKYNLTITSKNRKVSSQKRPFQINREKSITIAKFAMPVSGSSYRGEQQMKIIWPASIKISSGQQLDLVLLESSSKKVIKLNNNPVTASKGEFIWQVPDDGRVFGIYTLQARSMDDRVLSETNKIELLPNFVSFEKITTKNKKKEIRTDLEIAWTSFKGQNLEFLIMNNGPADISTSGLYGYNFTSYFVRKVPITSDDDLVICTSTLLTELPQGEGQVISLGRDPDCPLGEKEFGSKFEYVVNRFTLPHLENQFLIDPRPQNNISKFYWPE